MRSKLLVFVLALMLAGVVPSATSAAISSGFTGDYEPQHWTATGPGVTSITPASGATESATFGYSYSEGFSGQWTYAVTAVDHGLVSFDWNYSGFHSFYNVTAGLNVFANGPSGQVVQTLLAAGPAFCGACDPPSGGFNYSGTASIEVHQGYSFGIIASGSHFDGTLVLQGSVQVSNFKSVAACQPGYFSTDGFEPCTPAPAGSFVAGAGATAATLCPAGTFSATVGAIACTEAPAGSYVAAPGAAAATQCAPGSYQPNAGSISCLLADPGFYVDAAGAIAQTPCPAGTTSAAGAIECQSTQVLYDFTGFLAPIDNAPTLNVVKAGSAVPVKFGLGGDQGLGILAAGAPSSRPVTCDSGVPMSTDTPTTSAGASSLTYDPATGQYTYVWKTDKSWAGSCRELQLTLTDGSTHTARFKFK